LQRVAGFLTSTLSIDSFIGFRGLSPLNETANSRILVLIDGIRYNEWNYDLAPLGEAFPLDIESIDRIEVLKGAGSAVWGTNALYAVINVISKSGDSHYAKNATDEYASNNRGKAYTSWGDKTDGGLKYFSSASFTTENGDKAAFYPSFNDPESDNGEVEGVFKQRGYRANLNVSYDDAYANVVFGRSENTADSDVDFAFGDNGLSNYRSVPIRGEGGYKYKVWNEQNGVLLARSYYTHDRIRNQFEFPGASENTVFNANKTVTDAAGGELRYSQDIMEGVKGLVGFEYTRVYSNQFDTDFVERTPSGEIVDEGASGTMTDRTMQSYFFDLMYSPIDEATLFLGGRLDKFSELDPAFGPRASLVIQAAEHTVAKLMYSQGYRNPSIGEAKTTDSRPAQVDNETLNFYEASVEQRYQDWLNVTASIFYNDLSDTIGFAAFENGDVFYNNFKGFRSKGIELQATAQVDDDLQGYAHFTYAVGEDKSTGKDIESYPSYIARTGLSLGLPSAYLIASPEIMFASSSTALDGHEFDPYMIANLTLLSYPVAHGFNVSASVYNIFDKDFVRVIAARPDKPDSERAVEDGREFRLQANWRF